MSEPIRDDWAEDDRTRHDLAHMWERVDPLPDGLIGRMQIVAAAEQELVDADLDYELMLLVDRSHVLAGARGGAAYTLRFAYAGVDLLVRAAGAEQGPDTRLDGWLVPSREVTVRAQLMTVDHGSTEWESVVDANGRFEFHGLPPGLVRLWLTPADGARPFATPAFEI
ncbi:MAG: hypothetical protein ACRCYU_19555 [Nocardioides sp.]